MAFAKLYGTDGDQVLVKLGDDEDDVVKVKFYWEKEECITGSVAFSFTSSDIDQNWQLAIKCFKKVDEAFARAIIASVMQGISGVKGEASC